MPRAAATAMTSCSTSAQGSRAGMAARVNAALQKLNVIASEVGDRRWAMLGGRHGEHAFMASLLHPCAHIWNASGIRGSGKSCWDSSQRGRQKGELHSDGVHHCQRDDGVGSPVMSVLVDLFLDELQTGSRRDRQVLR